MLIESAYSTSYQWLIQQVPLALSRTISEIRRLTGSKSQIFRTPSHLAPSITVNPFEFLENPYGTYN